MIFIFTEKNSLAVCFLFFSSVYTWNWASEAQMVLRCVRWMPITNSMRKHVSFIRRCNKYPATGWSPIDFRCIRVHSRCYISNHKLNPFRLIPCVATFFHFLLHILPWQNESQRFRAIIDVQIVHSADSALDYAMNTFRMIFFVTSTLPNGSQCVWHSLEACKNQYG